MELAKPPLVWLPFFVLATTFQRNLELTAAFSLSSLPAAGPEAVVVQLGTFSSVAIEALLVVSPPLEPGRCSAGPV